ncbi:MAG: GNAT family protein [Acidobacteriota bacterium]
MAEIGNAPVIHAGTDLRLRPVSPAQVEIWFSVIARNKARLGRWLPWAALDFTLADIRRFLEDRERENASCASLTTGIWRAEVLCGSIGLHKIDKWHRSSSIGYWLDGANEGKGVMTDACRAMVTEGFRSYGLYRIEIRCATGNERSCAIPRRLGFVEEGILRQAEYLGDRWVDLRVFSMLEQDWRS